MLFVEFKTYPSLTNPVLERCRTIVRALGLSRTFENADFGHIKDATYTRIRHNYFRFRTIQIATSEFQDK